MIGIHSTNKIHSEVYRLSIIAENCSRYFDREKSASQIFLYSYVVEEKLYKSIPTK